MYSDIIYVWYSSLANNFVPKHLSSQSETSILTSRNHIGNFRFRGLGQNKSSRLVNWWVFPVISLKVRQICSIEMPETIHYYWGQAPKPPILSVLPNWERKTTFLSVYEALVFRGIPQWRMIENEAGNARARNNDVTSNFWVLRSIFSRRHIVNIVVCIVFVVKFRNQNIVFPDQDMDISHHKPVE